MRRKGEDIQKREEGARDSFFYQLSGLFTGA